MGDYEKNQSKLQKLMDDMLSDEEVFEYSSESYIASSCYSDSSNYSSSPVQKKKKKKVLNVSNYPNSIYQPSTSFAVQIESAEQEKHGENMETNPISSPMNLIDETIESVIRNFEWDSDTADEISSASRVLNWNEVTGDNLKHFTVFEQGLNINENISGMHDNQPIDFFLLFVDDDIMNLMVQETNKYASQKAERTNLLQARIRQWKDTTTDELKIFLGIQIWMGLVQMPSVTSYWCKNILYSNEIKSLMSRNRFELLLSHWHFADNQSTDTSHRLYKIKPLLNHISQKFQNAVTPSRNVCVDETLVPFRGRLSFLQYIKNKRHKFGVKVFKLCLEQGYTYDFKIYCGTEKNTTSDSVPTSIVMGLCKNLLDSGRTIFVDNYYTSMELAHKLLDRQTHLVGTLRKNRKGIPKDIVQKKLKKGEVIAKESDSGVVILKWCDKREVLMLTTKHKNEMVTVKSKNGTEKEKPTAIRDYNQNKSFIDLSDQLKAYSSCLRRSLKWYRKLAIEILLGSTIVNAFILYKQVTGKNITITQFREDIAKHLLNITSRENPPLVESHHIQEVNTTSRRRCSNCYKNMSEQHGRKYATSKATMSRYKCIQCDKFYCIPCFTSVHMCKLRV